MEDRLSNLDENKRLKIINSAMEEFSRNTYKKASTNRIVEKAGISKGSLFNYFQSKEKLYEYLEIFSIRAIADAIVERVDWEEPDILRRIKDIVMIKLEVCRKYPYLMGFSKRIYENKSMDDLKATYEKYVPHIYEKVYHENIDFSLFREDMGINEIMNILIWTFEKMGENYLKRMESGESIETHEIADEVDRYIKVLRKGFYR
ncbi:transcriptional regulator, TetR family [Dethiosulfatibacter aminovorans DSM 17477]|uniref:Transcriptional regulator, TetR family n=1 Tax=Dethiosulfatibacter aminovorans DSM 17477 TaxID=1121476 RepID=A0A1M6JV72_9FIRM|nr:TetR/AcrR family transcriptional regulator [Dethiosulfatibacter aminovorans]SHJ50591.1 transcriptional regulator, TetR family [Dethiosulfatibacter aminovorans DSM 17477]